MEIAPVGANFVLQRSVKINSHRFSKLVSDWLIVQRLLHLTLEQAHQVLDLGATPFVLVELEEWDARFLSDVEHLIGLV